MLSERPDQMARVAEIQGSLGPKIRELDVALGASNPRNATSPRVRDLLASKPGRTLVQWGVLEIDEIGGAKFIRLSAPKPPR